MNTTPDNTRSCIDGGCSAREEFDWLAFRYIANEMTASEVLDFEGQLCDDLAAQEAVARAVELTHAVVSVMEPEPIPSKSLRPGRRRLWWAMAATSAAALAVCVSFFIGQQTADNRRPGVAQRPDDDSKRKQNAPKLALTESAAVNVVEAWSNSGVELAKADPPVVQPMKMAQVSEDNEPVEEGEFDWVVSGLNGAATLMDGGNE